MQLIVNSKIVKQLFEKNQNKKEDNRLMKKKHFASI